MKDIAKTDTTKDIKSTSNRIEIGFNPGTASEYTIKTDKATLFGRDDLNSELKLQIIHKANTIKEYENWTHLLLNIVNQLKSSSGFNIHTDYATPIQKNLERISNVEDELIELQRKIIIESNKNTLKEDCLKEVNNKRRLLEEDISHSNKALLSHEIEQMMQSLNSISEELDFVSSDNSEYESKESQEIRSILKLQEDLKSLQEEKAHLLKIKEAKIQNQDGSEFMLKNKSKNSPSFNLSCLNSDLNNEKQNTIFTDYKK